MINEVTGERIKSNGNNNTFEDPYIDPLVIESQMIVRPDPPEIDPHANQNKQSAGTSPKFDISSQISKLKSSEVRVKKDKNKKQFASSVKRRQSGGHTRLSPEMYNFPSTMVTNSSG